jgi:mannose-6-phosphate isomerase-like protein (cupin superfamily)
MKIKLDKTDSKVVHSNKTYDVIDNTNLDKLIVSKTILHPGKETGGHNHSGQEEVYIFIKGRGKMVVGEETFRVNGKDTLIEPSIVLIPDGAFHKVFNTSKYKSNDDLEFICVFDGGRNH